MPNSKSASSYSLRFNFTTYLILLVCLLCMTPGFATDESRLWNALRSGGHVALMRHALAPGTGNPSEFKIGDCSTQRNLSDEGRKQAERIGARFRKNGIPSAIVYSSQWCRCLDTAKLLSLGPVKELPVLNSFHGRYERRRPQTQKLREWLARQDLVKPLVLVTHQVNINGLSDVYTSSGEIVIIRRTDSGDYTVIGKIQTD